MVWTDAPQGDFLRGPAQGTARSSGWSLCKRRNAVMRRPDHLPGGFAPESTLDGVVPLQGASALASADRCAGGQRAVRIPCYTLANRTLLDVSCALPAPILVRTRTLLFMK